MDEKYFSKCCNAPTKERGGCEDRGHDKNCESHHTCYMECQNCKQPCDWASTKEEEI